MLLALVDAYTRRRRRELRELGEATYLAFHNPQQLGKAYRERHLTVVPTSGPLAMTPKE